MLRVLTRLESGGLASVDGARWTLHIEILREVVTGHHWPPARARVVRRDGEIESPARAAVLRAFFRDGRLVRVPAQRTKRLVVLDRLAHDFEPGVRYPEVDVNELLPPITPTTPPLRRYLVEEDFLARENGVYWRTGGSVDALSRPAVVQVRLIADGEEPAQ